MAEIKSDNERRSTYWIVEYIGATAVILMFLHVLYFYKELPDSIPTHFNAKGEPDGFSQKHMAWLMPTVAFVTYISLVVVKRFPRFLSSPVKITKENANVQRRIGVNLVTALNIIIVMILFYISYSTIEIALGNKADLGVYFLPVMIIALLVPTGLYLHQSLTFKD